MVHCKIKENYVKHTYLLRYVYNATVSMHKSTKKMAKRLKFPAEFLKAAVFFSFFENFCKYCTVESKIVCRIRQNAKRKRKN